MSERAEVVRVFSTPDAAHDFANEQRRKYLLRRVYFVERLGWGRWVVKAEAIQRA